jgi:hypothetical protein
MLKNHALKAYGGVAVHLHEFLTLETDGGAFSFMPWPLYLQGTTPGNHSIEGWGRPISGLEDLQKIKIYQVKEGGLTV